MKAVIDTNVWLDWLVFDDPSVHALRAATAAGRLVALTPPRARIELADVLTRPAVLEQARSARARRGLAALDVAAALAAFDAVAAVAESAASCGLACTDPDDQDFADLAVACGARWLFTKDRALLRLARAAHQRFGLIIVAPARLPPSADL